MLKITIRIAQAMLSIFPIIAYADDAVAVKCIDLTFFKALGETEKVFPSAPAPAISPAEDAVYEVVINSKLGKMKLPPWIVDSFVIYMTSAYSAEPYSRCRLYRNEEWVGQSIFIPHNAPGGHGVILVNLTKKEAYLRIYRDDLKTLQPKVIHQLGSDQYLDELENALNIN